MGGGMRREREVSSVRAECIAPGSIEDGPWDAKRRRRRPERAPVVAPIFQIRPPLGRRSAKCDERSRAGQRRGAMVNASENRREAPRDPWRGPIEPCRAAIRPRVIRATRRGVETDTVGTAGIGTRPPRAFLLRTRTWWTGRDVDAGAALREATRLNASKGMGIQVGTVSCSSRGPDDASRAYRVMAAEAWSSIFTFVGRENAFPEAPRGQILALSSLPHCADGGKITVPKLYRSACTFSGARLPKLAF